MISLWQLLVRKPSCQTWAWALNCSRKGRWGAPHLHVVTTVHVRGDSHHLASLCSLDQTGNVMRCTSENSISVWKRERGVRTCLQVYLWTRRPLCCGFAFVHLPWLGMWRQRKGLPVCKGEGIGNFGRRWIYFFFIFGLLNGQAMLNRHCSCCRAVLPDWTSCKKGQRGWFFLLWSE